MMPIPTGLSLERLRSFLAIADAGGLSRAAPDDPVRQSQLCRQLKELEGALRTPLFDRTGRRLHLTEAGARLAQVVRDLDLGLESVSRRSDAPVSCRLGCGDSVLHWAVLPFAGALTSARVHLEVEALSSDDVVGQLHAAQLDLGLVRATARLRELRTVRLGKVEYRLFVPRSRFPSRAPTLQAVADALPFAMTVSEPALTDALASLGTARLRCETFPQVAAALRGGGAAGVLPRFATTTLPASDYWCLEAPGLGSIASTLVLAWRSILDRTRPELTGLRRALEKRVRALLE